MLGAGIDLGGFRLAGGTALAWHLGHRVSEDLDFFTFTPDALSERGCELFAARLARLEPRDPPYCGERTVHGTVGRCRVSFFEISGDWLDEPTRVAEEWSSRRWRKSRR